MAPMPSDHSACPDCVLRQQEITALIEPLRKLVEGRGWPGAKDRRDRFWDVAGQWTVYLTAEDHAHYRMLLEALGPDASDEEQR